MSLHREQDPSFLFDRAEPNSNIKLIMDKFYTETLTINQAFWAEADLDSRFRAGDQNLIEELFGGPGVPRRRFHNFNRIRRVCNMVSGFERRNRKSIVATPVEEKDAPVASQLSKVMVWAMERQGVLETCSTAFDQMLTTGMCLLGLWMDYRRDPVNGEIRVDTVPYNSFLIDPFFRKRDLSDCNFIWTRKWLAPHVVASLLPEHKEKIENLPLGDRDGRFFYMPESYHYGVRDLLTYDSFWYRTYRKQTLLIDMNSGGTMEWKGDDKMLKLFQHQFPQIEKKVTTVPTVNLAILVQNQLFYDEQNPLGLDTYPFVPVLGYFEPQLPYFHDRIQGMVRDLRTSQFLYSRRKIVELDILESQVNSGWIFKPKSLVNPKDVYLTGQGRGIALKQSAQPNDIQRIEPPQVPASMIELSKLLGQEIQEISGVNEELLGSATDEKAGVLSMLRQGAGLTTLQILFDQFDYSKKLLGRLFLDVIKNNFTEAKVARILGEQPAQEFATKAFGEYDVAVEEGAYTTTQKQMEFRQLLELRELGVEIPSKSLVRAASLQGKEKLLQEMDEEKQQMQEQQQKALQLELEEKEATIQGLRAQAEANRGLGLERASRVQENRSLAIERLAEAQRDRDAGSLDLLKAAREIEGLDLEHLEKAIGVAKTLQEMQHAQEAVDREDIQRPTVEEAATLQQSEGGKGNGKA